MVFDRQAVGVFLPKSLALFSGVGPRRDDKAMGGNVVVIVRQGRRLGNMVFLEGGNKSMLYSRMTCMEV